jgi:hypothetical protein
MPTGINPQRDAKVLVNRLETTTMTLTIQLSRRFSIRARLGIAMMRLGARIMPWTCNVEVGQAERALADEQNEGELKIARDEIRRLKIHLPPKILNLDEDGKVHEQAEGDLPGAMPPGHPGLSGPPPLTAEQRHEQASNDHR